MSTATVTVYLPDREARRRVRQAAKLAGKPPTVFMREVVLEATDKIIAKHAKRQGRCPTCGAKHEATRHAA